MARSFGRLFASIWDDEDFRAVPVPGRLMYAFLVSQPDLDHAGVIPLRERRWSHDLALPVSDITECIKGLSASRFVVVDEDTEELLVRSLIRRDEIWKQPNVFKSAASSAVAVKSAAIKNALLGEIRRLDLGGASREIQRIRDELATLLEPFGNPSPTPPEPSQGPISEDASETPVDGETDISAHTGNGAGQNPSGTLPEPLPRGTSELRGKGSSYGPVLEGAFPLSLSPSPSPQGRREPPAGPPHPPLLNLATTGEGGDLDQEQDLLVAEVRAKRPDWSTASIRRALGAESVAERPWPLVRAAMLAVASDPASDQPGRLAHDGPWWRQNPATPVMNPSRTVADAVTGAASKIP